MKKTLSGLIIVLMLSAACVFAAEIADVDRVSVLMPKAKVLSILGAPDETLPLAKGLKVDVYHMRAALPLLHAGCIYNSEGVLMGQSLVFQGHTAGDIVDRLKHHGFVPLSSQAGSLRFSGFDDDTGHPLVAVIAEGDALTTITTFEKAFYETHVK